MRFQCTKLQTKSIWSWTGSVKNCALHWGEYNCYSLATKLNFIQLGRYANSLIISNVQLPKKYKAVNNTSGKAVL